MPLPAQTFLGPDCVFFDTETTGLDGNAQIIEIVVLDASGEAVFESRLRPSVPIDRGAQRIHGISAADLRNEPRWPDIAEQIEAALSGKTLVGFNVQYDHRMLLQTAKAFGCRTDWIESAKTACVMKLAVEILGTKEQRAKGRMSLAAATGAAGVRWTGAAHGAKADTLATLDLARAIAEIRASIPSVTVETAFENAKIPVGLPEQANPPVQVEPQSATEPSSRTPEKMAAMDAIRDAIDKTLSAAPIDIEAFMHCLATAGVWARPAINAYGRMNGFRFGLGFGPDEISFSGSQVGEEYRWAALQEKVRCQINVMGLCGTPDRQVRGQEDPPGPGVPVFPGSSGGLWICKNCQEALLLRGLARLRGKPIPSVLVASKILGDSWLKDPRIESILHSAGHVVVSWDRGLSANLPGPEHPVCFWRADRVAGITGCRPRVWRASLETGLAGIWQKEITFFRENPNENDATSPARKEPARQASRANVL